MRKSLISASLLFALAASFIVCAAALHPIFNDRFLTTVSLDSRKSQTVTLKVPQQTGVMPIYLLASRSMADADGLARVGGLEKLIDATVTGAAENEVRFDWAHDPSMNDEREEQFGWLRVTHWQPESILRIDFSKAGALLTGGKVAIEETLENREGFHVVDSLLQSVLPWAAVSSLAAILIASCCFFALPAISKHTP